MLLLFNEVPVSSSIISLADTYWALSERLQVKRVAGRTVPDAQLGMGMGTCLCTSISMQ